MCGCGDTCGMWHPTQPARECAEVWHPVHFWSYHAESRSSPRCESWHVRHDRPPLLLRKGALAQIDRLMPDVPGLAPITQRPVLRSPVAVPAELVELRCGHP